MRRMNLKLELLNLESVAPVGSAVKGSWSGTIKTRRR